MLRVRQFQCEYDGTYLSLTCFNSSSKRVSCLERNLTVKGLTSGKMEMFVDNGDGWFDYFRHLSLSYIVHHS
jgi:hypothetical protein